jgi:hypothetical protein
MMQAGVCVPHKKKWMGTVVMYVGWSYEFWMCLQHDIRVMNWISMFDVIVCLWIIVWCSLWNFVFEIMCEFR